MTSSAGAKPSSLFGKAWWVLRYRPQQFYQAARGYSLFYLAHCLRTIFPIKGVLLGENVRLQRSSCLMAEQPQAEIEIGAHSIVYEHAKVEAYGQGCITIGPCSILGDIRIASRYSVKIGARFLSSWNVFIQDFDPHPLNVAERAQQVQNMVAEFKPQFGGAVARSPGEPLKWEYPGAEIVVGDDVWVGANATILKGAHIGDGCIVGAGAVVSKGEYPAGSIIAGNPAKILKR
jgi:acetyltransferase-like isoleucine patch superfamily enzyme